MKRSPISYSSLLLGLLAIMMAVPTTQAQSLRETSSLKFVPADTAFYTTSLRNREQCELLTNSRAFAKLKSLRDLEDLSEDPAHADVRQRLRAEAMDGWDPDAVRAAAGGMWRDYRFVVRWGRALRPPLADRMPPPPASIEDDVDLL